MLLLMAAHLSCIHTRTRGRVQEAAQPESRGFLERLGSVDCQGFLEPQVRGLSDERQEV